MSLSKEKEFVEISFVPAVGFELSLGFFALFLGWLFQHNPRAYLPEFWDWQNILWGAGVGILSALPLIAFGLALNHLPWSQLSKLQDYSRTRLVPLFGQMTSIELVLFSICSGIGEELLFRGWLMMLLTGELPSPNPWSFLVIEGLVLSAIAFGLCHYVSPSYLVVATIAGLYFGVLLIWTENLLVPIVAHALYDAVMIFWLIRSHRDNGS